MRRFLGGVTAGLAVALVSLGVLSVVVPPDQGPASGIRLVESPTDTTVAAGAIPQPPEPVADPAGASPAAGGGEIASDTPVGTMPADPEENPGSEPVALASNASPAERGGESSLLAALPGSDSPASDLRPAPAVPEEPAADPGYEGTEPSAASGPVEQVAEPQPIRDPISAAPEVLLSDIGESGSMAEAANPVAGAPAPASGQAPVDHAASGAEGLPVEPEPPVTDPAAAPRALGPAGLPAAPRPEASQQAAVQPRTPAVPAHEAAPAPTEPLPAMPVVGTEVPVAPAPPSAAAGAPAPIALAAASSPAMPLAPPPAGAPDVAPPDEVAAPATYEPPATEPAVWPAVPGRIRLEGAALPGTDAVRVNRPGLDPVAEEPPPVAAPETTSDDAPALRRFAASWERPAEALPLMSFVLLDDGAATPEALAALPVPVSIALDPNATGATGRMAALRAAGLEVLAVATLPPNPRPTDVEVFLGPALDTLPEAVAVLDLGEGGLRSRDATAAMALSRLARAGLGAVLVSGGLGRGAEGAEAAGVPATEILRDLDGAAAGAILRQLDDAARRARQDGEAVLLARPTPETLQALAAWTREREAQGVAVAPVSAVLAP